MLDAKPFGGGVASDIRVVDTVRGKIVVKEALPELKVDAYWPSDPSRSLVEAQALQTIAELIGDDLFATNAARIEQGIARKAANAVLIKLNQNDTLAGTLDAFALARSAGYATVISARSGETEDSFIADFAVGTGAGQIKVGSLRNSERLSKYNQLLRIAEDTDIAFSGHAALTGQGSS